MRCRKGVIGRMIFMRRLLACLERANAAERNCHAADAGVIVGQRAQRGLDELDEVRIVGEEGVLPERSERFSARGDMPSPGSCRAVLAYQDVATVFCMLARHDPE